MSPLRLQEGRYTFDLDDLEAKLRQETCRVFLLCSPHNPVGRVWSREELAAVGELCCRHGVYILSDEIHADLILGPRPHTPIASLSPELAARTVTCMAPTKTFNMAGLPISHVIVPDEALRRTVQRAFSASGHGACSIASLAAARAAYLRGEPWLEGLLDYLRGNLSYLRLAFPAGAPIRALDTEGTYLAWLDCRGLGLPEGELDRFMLQKAGVWLDDGTMFGPGGEGFTRLNFACPRPVLEQAVGRIRRAAGME